MRVGLPHLRVVALAVSVLALGAWHATPVRATRFTTVATPSRLDLVSDGARYVVVFTGPQLLRVIDASRGDAAFDVRIPPQCASDTFPILVTAGGGRALVFCFISGPSEPPALRPFLLEIATRSWHDVPGYDALLAASSFADLDLLGSRWVEGTVSGGPHVWLDLRTGARRTDPGTWRQALDLDSPGLLRPLCAPLRRELPLSATDLRAFEPYTYAPPYGVLYSEVLHTIAIQRCGDPQPTVLARNSGFDGAPGALDGGVLTYASGTSSGVPQVAHAFLPACRASLSWKRSPGLYGVAHAGRAIYTLTHPFKQNVTTLRVLRLPPGCPPGDELAVSSGAGSARALASGGRWTAASLAGASVVAMPGPGRVPTPVSVRAGATVTLRTSAVARSVRWRIGGRSGLARRLGRPGLRWQLRLPRGAGTVEVRVAAGGVARFRLRAR